MITMRVSIAMATFNGEKYLISQLHSIEAQKRIPEEIVICDDASGDRTFEILEQFRSRCRCAVRIVRNEENLGYAKNFQKAISLCSGDLIALCDQDDVWYPDKLSRLADGLLHSDGTALACSDSDLIDETGARVGRTAWERMGVGRKKLRTLREKPFGLLLHGPCITGMTMMFRADLRSRALPIPEGWPHDAWIAMVASIVSDIKVIPECLSGYRVHPNQLTYVPASGRKPREPLAIRSARYLEGARRYQKAIERVRRWGDDLPTMDAIRHLDGKAGFMLARSRIYQSRFWWPLVARQWLLGGYSRYGSGVRGVVGDMALLGNPTGNEM